MNYSNESFERFQQTLKQEVEEESLLWLLRDALFAEAFYGNKRKFTWLYSLPFGWLLVLAFLWIQSWRKLDRSSISKPSSASHHFLFLSSRSGHTQRLLPLFRNMRQNHPCTAWYTHSVLRKLAKDDELPDFRCVVAAWTRHTKWSDLREARFEALKIQHLFSNEINRTAYSALTIYLVQFFAWHRFWQSRLGRNCQSITSTFEKAPMVKAFFHAARELGVPTRIHWIHGLRHASLQSTLATNLWCMTPGDVRYLQPRVPRETHVEVRDNPECVEIAEKIGVLDATDKSNIPLRFLFLGPGANLSYTKSMRVSDLKVIQSIQEYFGERIEWRMRPHPSKIERFNEELAEAGVKVSDFSTRPLYEDLKWSHAVGTATSSLLLDWRETGRSLFWIQAELRNICAVNELVADGIGIHLSAENSINTLKKAFPNLNQ